MEPILFAMPGNESITESICRAHGWTGGEWVIRHFPDGESHVRYLTPIAGRDVVLVCTLADPDAKVLALYLAACVARELGAGRVGLVVPYLAYMRQDRRFQDGEGVTARHFARLLSGVSDWMVTVDPHLHRIKQLGEVYSIPTCVVHAAPYLARWIADRIERPLLVGPDEESAQWVAAVAGQIGCPYVVLQKTRRGDREVEVSVPGIEQWQDRTPVLVDDIASTARTLIAAAASIRAARMRAPWCVVVHAIFAGEAYEALLASGVAGVASTNTVPHRSNCIGLAQPLAAAIGAWVAGLAGTPPAMP